MVSSLSSFLFLVHGLLFGEIELLQSYTKPKASICVRYVFSVVPNYFQNYRIQIDSKSNSLAIPHRGSI
ncbi:hypothetical protein LOK49_LG04G00692 [Camellia lanceoleosa]|uniref:Uncharacterized protein n=1 Tax=Camellia lanceoleosa TaxID=1840588 RepID=A0ACC0I0T7_9ERIC|nr:hypothetical protein LOK49_LG04G00692 [Camellia lanceoleosa]